MSIFQTYALEDDFEDVSPIEEDAGQLADEALDDGDQANTPDAVSEALTTAEAAASKVEDALDQLRASIAENGVATESDLAYALGTLHAVSAIVGIPAEMNPGLESATPATVTAVSLENMAKNAYNTIKTAIINMIKSIQKFVTKYYDRIFDTGMRMARAADKMKAETSKLDGPKKQDRIISKSLPGIFGSKTVDGNRIKTILGRHVDLVSAPANYSSLPDGDNFSKDLEKFVKDMKLNALTGGRYKSEELANYSILELNLSSGTTDESKTLASMSIHKVNSMDLDTGTFIPLSTSDANDILTSVAKIGNEITKQKRESAKLKKDLDTKLKETQKASKKDDDASGVKQAKESRSQLNQVSKIAMTYYGKLRQLHLSACKGALSAVKLSLDNVATPK